MLGVSSPYARSDGRSATWGAALFILTTILAPLPALSLDCGNAPTTIDMQECASRDLAREDARLNKAYQKLMKLSGLDNEARGLLQDAQRKWIQFRDAKCAFEADAWRGGTGASLIHLGCVVKTTELRAGELEAELESR